MSKTSLMVGFNSFEKEKITNIMRCLYDEKYIEIEKLALLVGVRVDFIIDPLKYLTKKNLVLMELRKNSNKEK
jgi:hypothetical protein